MPGGSGFGWFLVAPGQLVTRPVLPQGAGDSFGVPSPGWGRVVRGREPGHRFLLCQWPRMIQAGTRPFPTLPGSPGSPLGGVRLAGPYPWEQPVVWGEGRGEGRPVLTAAWGCCGGRPGNGSPPGASAVLSWACGACAPASEFRILLCGGPRALWVSAASPASAPTGWSSTVPSHLRPGPRPLGQRQARALLREQAWGTGG